MGWLLSPATAVLIRTRNSVKLPAMAALFSIPLAIAALAQPFAWLSPAGAAVIVTYLFAIYVGVAHYQASEEAWKVVRTVASRLNDRDLRGGGDLLSQEEVRQRLGAGQFSQLFNTLSEAHRSLRELVGQARASSEAARGAADQLAAGNVSISTRTEEQASTLEETAAAMEQLSATIRENADSCRQASELVAGATVVARNGAGVAHEAVATMDLIEKSAKRIADIISVIDGIAFQTNILALNAAVEAARAGEQGRGFAVVASEVRSLAQRSAQAAREIKALIGDSLANVGQGTRLVNDTGRIINEVTASVEQVNELIGIIAIASREQSGGVDSVNRALAQLQGVTQQNASVVQDAAYAAVTLKEEAGRLFDLVGRFRMDEARAAAPHTPPAPPRKRLAAAAEEWQQF